MNEYGNSNGRHPWIGKTIGTLAFERELGRGYSATVLLALQEQLDREVAVKVLSEEFCRDRARVQSFIREARRAEKLRHPHVLRVFGAAVFENRYYMITEYASRGTVQDLIERKGRLPQKNAVHILRQAAEGLAFAEEQGLVHRDVKPANLLVTEDETIKIGDLGISAVAGHGALHEDSIFGSPLYISPEQASGRPVTSRSDIYSLGATFYHMLTGRTPFKDTGRRGLIIKHLHEEPVPVNRVVPVLRKNVAELVKCMMAKQPDKRCQSFNEVIERLASLEKARPPSRATRRIKRPRRLWKER